MSPQDAAPSSYSTSFTVDQSPTEVFDAINDVRSWWTGQIDGDTQRLGDEFTYRYQDLHLSKQRITESVPGKRIAWEIVEGAINFVEDKAEWIQTVINFDIATVGDHTEVRFAHVGLTPDLECFDNCSSAWSYYINSSLREFIIRGGGQLREPRGTSAASEGHDLADTA